MTKILMFVELTNFFSTTISAIILMQCEISIPGEVLILHYEVELCYVLDSLFQTVIDPRILTPSGGDDSH